MGEFGPGPKGKAAKGVTVEPTKHKTAPMPKVKKTTDVTPGYAPSTVKKPC